MYVYIYIYIYIYIYHMWPLLPVVGDSGASRHGKRLLLKSGVIRLNGMRASLPKPLFRV